MKTQRQPLMCIHCKHRTIQYAPYIKKRILGCNARDCKYERREDGEKHSVQPRKI